MTRSVRDIAAHFAVGQHTVLHWIARGDLKAINCGRERTGKKPRWRITDAALEAFENIRSASAPKPPHRRTKEVDVIEFYK